MSLRSRIASLWRNLLHGNRVERDLDDEVRATFDLLVDEKVEAGISAREARRAAALELGGVESVKQQVRDVRAGAVIDSLLQDIRYAARALRRSPLFTATAAISLALGLAGNAIVFSLADVYLVRNRPGMANPQRLAEVGRIDSGAGLGFYSGDGFDTFSYPNYVDVRARQTVFEGLAAYHDATFGLGTGDNAVRVSGAHVSGNYFAVLGVPIARGRGFLPEEEQLASPKAVVVVSDRLWRSAFDADPEVIGRTIRLNGRPFTIVGVTAPGFAGYTIGFESLWAPITGYPDGNDLRRVSERGRQWLMGIGRLKEGVTIAQARADMARIAADLEREYPDDNRRHGLGVEPSGAMPVVARSIVTRFVGLLFALVALVLLIACFNVAGMLLARGVTRTREISIRLALGAARRRIVRLLVIESLLVSALGTAGGLAGAWIAIRLIARVLPILRLDIFFDLAVDWRVTAFSVVVATLVGLASGVVPARAATHMDLASAVVHDTTAGTRRLRGRSAIVTAQVALSVLLVVCALLLGRSVLNAGRIDPGFDLDGIEVVGLNLELGGYDRERGRVFSDSLMSRVENLPGVESAAAARVVPLTGEQEGGRAWLPEEYGDERAIDASQNIVTPGYFRTLGLQLVAGRNFTAADRGTPGVAIVNETLARRAWPGRSALGKRLVLGQSRYPLNIIGVARDAKYRTIGEGPTPFFYVPAAQRYESTMWLLIRPRGPGVLPQVRAVIRGMDPNVPILQAAPLTELTAFTLFPQRFAAWLAAIVGATGLLLAALGVYGVTAYNVSQRRREIGIRVALGAMRAQVLRSILGQGMRLAAAGAALGLAAAALVSRLLEGLLYDVRPLDPVSFAGAVAAILALALFASAIPARRAAAIDAAETLRAE